MACFLVFFDINDNKRRTDFKEKGLKPFGGYCPLTEDSWAITTTDNAITIRDKLLKLLTSQDRLFIIRSGSEAAWFNSYGEKHNEWLKSNL